MLSNCARAMDIFVVNFGEYHALLYQMKPRLLVGFMTAAHLGSQAFYMQRAWVLSGRNRLVAVFFGTAWYVLWKSQRLGRRPKLLSTELY